jgi:hypothetical protein
LILFVKEIHDSWQTSRESGPHSPSDCVRKGTLSGEQVSHITPHHPTPLQSQARLKRNSIRRRCDER